MDVPVEPAKVNKWTLWLKLKEQKQELLYWKGG